jgi:WD40 repeat protein
MLCMSRQLRWVVRGIEKNETLVSISTDGAVLEWNLKKGLAVSTLMYLKRSGMGEGWISRQAAGLCFDFVPDDPGQSTYVVGTEEGHLHKCSVSYNEQYLETYSGHNGPLYKVRFSKHCPHLFLTCSADWSMGLYDIRHKEPLAVMRSSGEDFSINDICFCPGNSTVFAAVTADARLQIWDLQVSCLDPVESYDTSVDDCTIVPKEVVAEAAKEEGNRAGTSTTAKPNTAAGTRYEVT